MIQAHKLSKHFFGIPLFSEATFTLSKGEICALVGRNGSGKTTLLKMMAGLETPDSGDLVFPRNYKIGYLKQHIHFTEKTLVDELCKACSLQENQRYLAEKMLLGFGFSYDDFEKSPSLFSGGMQLRLELAKVLLLDPDMLLLDEPTNYLDITSIHYLKEFLQDWKKEAVIISHDRDFLDATCNTVLGIHRAKMLKVEGSTQDYYQMLLEQEKQHEHTRQNVEKQKEKLEKFIERFGAKATKAKQAQSKSKALQKLPRLEELSRLMNLSFSFPFAPFPGKKMIEARHIYFSFDPLKSLITDFNIEVQKQEKIGIIGANGKGKSTLLTLLAGIREPLDGELKLYPNLEIGYFGQTNIERLDPKRTVLEEIAAVTPPLPRESASSIAGLMQFPGIMAEKKIGSLSGGEKSRVLLGKILAKPCNILFLDEPTHHLDLESIEGLLGALETFPGTLIMVTHSEYILESFPFDKIIHCSEQGQTLHLGNYSEIRDKILEDTSVAASPKKQTSSQEARLASKEVAKLKKRIEKHEEEIAKFENELAKLYEQLSIETNKEKILVLAKKQQEMQKKIEALYHEYDSLLCELSSIS